MISEGKKLRNMCSKDAGKFVKKELGSPYLMALEKNDIKQLNERCNKEYVELDGLDDEEIDEIED